MLHSYLTKLAKFSVYSLVSNISPEEHELKTIRLVFFNTFFMFTMIYIFVVELCCC